MTDAVAPRPPAGGDRCPDDGRSDGESGPERSGRAFRNETLDVRQAALGQERIEDIPAQAIDTDENDPFDRLNGVGLRSALRP